MKLGALLGLARTHYVEVSRQPLFGVSLALGVALVLLSPVLSVFAIGPAQAMVMDLGASSALFFCVFLSAAIVAPSVAERLADGTATVVLTRPVSPFTYLLGAWLGALLALGQAALLLGVALGWAVRNGPHSWHAGVVSTALPALVLALGWGLVASLRERSFQVAAQSAATVLFPLAAFVGLLIGRDGGLLGGAADPHGHAEALNGTVLAAAWLAYLAAAAYAGLGLALATRLPGEAAATLTLLGFVLGTLVQSGLGDGEGHLARDLGVFVAGCGAAWVVASGARQRPLLGAGLLLVPLALAAALLLVPTLSVPARLWGGAAATLLIWLGLALTRWELLGLPWCVAVGGLVLAAVGDRLLGGGMVTLALPDLQLFWIADAAYNDQLVPLGYVLGLSGYAALYGLGAVLLGGCALEGRELR